jgi:dihydroorotase
MGIVINGGRIIDPSRQIDETGDLYIRDGEISAVRPAGQETRVIDARGLWVVPGLIDAHVHLREPGQTEKEDIRSGLAAAAAGGFTAVLPMPNTTPANDTPEITRAMIEKAEALGGPAIYPVAAVTVGRRGEKLGDLEALKQAGAVAFSDDGSAVVDDALMARALEKCAALGMPLAQHAEDPALVRGGVVHEGEVSRKLGLPGWPAEAEERIVARDIALAEKTGAQLHVSHISTRGAIELVREAKAKGISVTAEVTPHHLYLTDQAVLDQGAEAKVNPPLRTRSDVAALRQALEDGDVDIIATDHAPHTLADKAGGLEQAAFGMVGLEIAVPLMLGLVDRGMLSPMRMIEAMSTAPARIFGLPGGTLEPGAPADVAVINPKSAYIIKKSDFKSKGRNTPFEGRSVPGRVVGTFIKGRIVYGLDVFQEIDL